VHLYDPVFTSRDKEFLQELGLHPLSAERVSILSSIPLILSDDLCTADCRRLHAGLHAPLRAPSLRAIVRGKRGECRHSEENRTCRQRSARLFRLVRIASSFPGIQTHSFHQNSRSNHELAEKQPVIHSLRAWFLRDVSISTYSQKKSPLQSHEAAFIASRSGPVKRFPVLSTGLQCK
jgi:hypothetical protein